MLAWESGRTRGRYRDRRRLAALSALETLEQRELLAYSPFGTSLPDLSVQGAAAPVASWGGNLAVSASVANTGANTYADPQSTDRKSVV